MIKKYPPPKYELIIEPFAGTARYSLLYHDRQVVLNDLYTVIADNWKYLINATPEQIMNLPNLNCGDDLRDLNLPLVEKNLLGFVVARGETTPNNYYSAWASKSNDIERFKKRVLGYLDKIRHFKIICEDYRSLNNLEATWFIDPPYQVGGHKYVHNQINYEELAEWCKTRNGQVIVCEQVPADWLEFRPLTEVRGLRKNHKELIWTN